MKEKVAVIGMGISGMGVLLAYAKEVPRHPNSQIDIDCYDAPESFGKGVPFRETSPHALNNLRSPQISYDYENLEDFASWLKAQGKVATGYAKRSLFGQYMDERSQALMESLAATAYHTRIIKLDWLPLKKKWRLTPEHPGKGPQAEVLYDRVHLCCGELPTGDFYQLKGQLHYVHEIYPLADLPATIKETDKVAIIGMGLAAIDVVRHLLRETKPAQLVMFSKENYFPVVRGDDIRELEFNYLTFEALAAIIEAQEGFFTVENFKHLLDQELAVYGLSFETITTKYYQKGLAGVRATLKEPEEVGLIQAVLKQANAVMADGWDAMDETERERFSEDYQKIMVILSNPMPPESAAELLVGDDAGWLNLYDVKAVEVIADSNQLQLVTKEGSVEVDWVINATGMDLSLQGIDKGSLLSHLLNRRYTMVDTAGGFSMNYGTSNIFSPRFGEWSTLHAHGVLVNGVRFQNNDALKIQRTAHLLVKRLLAK